MVAFQSASERASPATVPAGGDVQVLVDHYGFRDQDHFGLAAPGPEFYHDKGQVLGESVQRGPVPAGGAFNHQHRDVCLALEARAVAGPVVENPEAVGSVDFSELHLHAVVGIAVTGKDVQASAARCAQLLSDNADLAQAQPRRVSSEPVLQPYLVISQVPQLRRLPGAHRKPWRIAGHEDHRSDPCAGEGADPGSVPGGPMPPLSCQKAMP